MLNVFIGIHVENTDGDNSLYGRVPIVLTVGGVKGDGEWKQVTLFQT